MPYQPIGSGYQYCDGECLGVEEFISNIKNARMDTCINVFKINRIEIVYIFE